VPAARTLLGWAGELGIDVGDDPRVATTAGAGSGAESAARTATPDGCLRAIAIKGFATLPGLADAVLATPEDVRPIVDRLAIEGLVGISAGAYWLTDAGRLRSDGLRTSEQAAWGLDRAVAALDAFLDLDHRMKDTVTAWQLRDADAQLVNDHTDAAYDEAVLDRLAALHAEAMAWLATAAAGCPRLADYGERLGRALEAARGGDARFVASPRVDSYHGTWFELHEDLIQLAGRNRADEVAAGRA
jgi:pyruvate,orthophosphate dikinase